MSDEKWASERSSQGCFKATGAAVGNKTFTLVSAAKLWGRLGLICVKEKKHLGAKCEQDVRAAGCIGLALILLLSDDTFNKHTARLG